MRGCDSFSDKVVRGEPVAPVKITVNAAGHTLVDFGKHFFGWIEVDAPVAGPYRFIWGELLDEHGSVQTDPFFTKEQGRVRCALAEDRFAGEGWERVPYQKNAVSAFAPTPVGRFGTVMPFRWLEVVEAPFPITVANVRQVPIHYPYDMGEERFDCDSPELVRVHDFCKHSILATTFTGKFVDGDRERLPYEADSYITQLGTYAITSDDTLARAMADYLATHTTWPTEWKQFFISILHADWMHSGKTDLVEKHYAAMRDSKSWRHLRRDDGLLVSGGPSVRPAPDGETPEDIVDWAKCYRDGFVFREVNTVVNALHIRNLRELSAMAAALGRDADAAQFAVEAEQTFAAFNAKLWDPSRGRYRDGEGTDHATVQGNAMALACGAVPRERVAAVADYVVSKGMSCSTYMAQFVLEALFMAGRDRDAIALMTSSAHRGWLAMMGAGATITPEFWDLTLEENGRIPDMNHAWSTAPLNAISRHVLGVEPAKPGFAEIAVRPHPGGLGRLSGVVPTPRGKVRLAMGRRGGLWRVSLDTPAPTRFEAFGDNRCLPAGAHEFEIRPPDADASASRGTTGRVARNVAAPCDPAWVKVAAANSSAAATSAADFVCTGEHDEETIQRAIDLCAADGRGLLLHNGLYRIDAFRDWGDGGPRAAVRVPLVRRTFAIEGTEAFQNGDGAVPEDLSNWRNGVVWYVREEAWETAGEGVPSVLRGAWCRTSSQNATGIRIANVSVFVCDPQRPVRCIDCRWWDAVRARDMTLFAIGRRIIEHDEHPYRKFGPLKMPHHDCIGLTMTSGSNTPVSRFDNILAIGFGQGIQAGGEHVVCNDCYASKGLYGWTFGNYEYSRGAHNHPIVLVNCADEQNVHLPLFAAESDASYKHQSVTMIGCNFERMAHLVIGGKLGDGMREAKPGTWRGRIEYTDMPGEASPNEVELPLWEPDGSGSGFETRNLAHKRVGTSAERRSYHPFPGQQFFDTDLGKLLVCADPAKRLWVDALGRPADGDDPSEITEDHK